MNVTAQPQWVAFTVDGRINVYWNYNRYVMTQAQYDEFKTLDALEVPEATQLWLNNHDNQEEVSS